MAYKNKEDAKKCRDKWYYNNKEKQLKKQRERRQFLMKLLTRFKSFLKCIDCGMSFRGKEECCDFHHVDPTKKDFVMRVAADYSKATLKRELLKCVPLCSNCHRTRHKNMGFGNGSQSVSKTE